MLHLWRVQFGKSRNVVSLRPFRQKRFDRKREKKSSTTSGDFRNPVTV